MGFYFSFNLLAAKIMSLREVTMQFGGVFLGDGTRCAPQQPEVLVDNRPQAFVHPPQAVLPPLKLLTILKDSYTFNYVCVRVYIMKVM